MSARLHAAPSLFRSFVAGLACALVLGLGLLAYSPAAHAWLHKTACGTSIPHTHAESDADGTTAPAANVASVSSDHFCAITAFAQGADTPAQGPLVAAPVPVSIVAPKTQTEIRLGRIEHLLPSGRAPPVA